MRKKKQKRRQRRVRFLIESCVTDFFSRYVNVAQKRHDEIVKFVQTFG